MPKSCNSERPSDGDGAQPAARTVGSCPPTCRLVRLTAVSGATQQNVTGAHNRATLKLPSESVIVEAATEPGTAACWSQIAWSVDTGTVVPGVPNQRRLSRARSARLDIRADPGGVSDELSIWVLWATVQILTSGRRPPNAQAHPPRPFGDGSDQLGAIEYDSLAQQRQVAGKIVAVGTIAPPGVHDVISSGWAFRRKRWTYDWVDGRPSNPGNGRSNQWNTDWVDDTLAAMSVLNPDLDDKIYDTDAPNPGTALNDFETYNNLQQWVEWNGSRASDDSPWYFQARWQRNRALMKDVSTGNIQLPSKSHLHP